MARSRREEVEALVRIAGAEPLVGFAVAWVVPPSGRGPVALRQRRHHLVVHGGDELLLVRPRRRRRLELDDVVARLPARPGSLRRERQLGMLRQLVVDDPDRGSPRVIELPLRSRRFAATLVEALRGGNDMKGEASP